ncbi:iron complex transport system permease protein [Brevibacterium sp. Mu109]|uniref:FecCD family ABC transporter permease n=1 Tax=Brevibacterium sp. Mu109 TaxID=1255669 RepID=UPI000C426EA0|nr:iron ABC transporter permease [Brevibacterium sp. Mu109]MDN5893964.1 iron ABC transporter permease [Nocardioides sp.]SMX86879.1 iron complex transport system permease protein [Brevibacterium sp. Mu109]
MLRGGWSRTFGLGVAVVVLVAATWASIVLGINDITVGDVLDAVRGTPATDAERIVYHLRIPRTATGLLVGAGLGVAGATMQGLTRNPLADPGLLGINAGAALAVVVAMAGLGITTASGYVWFAFAGAACAALFVYALGSLGLGGATPVKLILAGAATTAFLGAITTMITLRDASLMDDYRFWAVGSLTRANGAMLLTVAPFIVAGLLLAMASSRSLNALALGDDLARSLGTRVRVSRAIGAIAVVLLAGGSTTIAGPVAFIGLVIPHIARMISGPDYRWVMAWTLVMAPTVLLIADVVGRLVAQPQQLQVGIVVAAVGAPFFLYLVRHRKLVGV